MKKKKFGKRRRMEFAEQLRSVTLKLGAMSKVIGENGYQEDLFLQAIETIINDQIGELKRLTRVAGEFAEFSEPMEIGAI